MLADYDPDVIGDMDHNKILQQFFSEVLGLDEQRAEEGAATIQQAVSPEIISRIVEYTTHLKHSCPDQEQPAGSFQRFLRK